MSKYTQLGGHSAPRSFFNAAGPNVGLAIMQALSRKVQQLPGIEVREGVKVRGVRLGFWLTPAKYVAGSGGCVGCRPNMPPMCCRWVGHVLQAEEIIVHDGRVTGVRIKNSEGKWSAAASAVVSSAKGISLMPVKRWDYALTLFNATGTGTGTEVLACDALVLAAGGFAANKLLLQVRHAPAR